MISLDSNNKTLFHHYQNIMIVKELQEHFGEIYVGRKKIIATDVLFFVDTIRIDCDMDAD